MGAVALRKWLMRLFLWDLEVKLKRTRNDEKILYLANRLMNEVKAQGYELQPTTNQLESISIDHFIGPHHQDGRYPNLKVGNICAHWSVDGFRVE